MSFKRRLALLFAFMLAGLAAWSATGNFVIEGGQIVARNLDIQVIDTNGQPVSCAVLTGNADEFDQRGSAALEPVGATNEQGHYQDWLIPGVYRLEMVCLSATLSGYIMVWPNGMASTYNFDGDLVSARGLVFEVSAIEHPGGCNNSDSRCPCDCSPPTTPVPTPSFPNGTPAPEFPIETPLVTPTEVPNPII